MEELEKVEVITPEIAGKVIHKNAEFVRAGLRQGKFEFGTAVESSSGQWNYLIIKSKFMKYIGIEEKNKENTNQEEMVYTVNEVSKLLKTNANYVYSLINLGLLAALKLGSYKVRKKSLEDFLEKYEGKDLTNPQNIEDLKIIKV